MIDQRQTPVALVSVPARGPGVTTRFSLAAGRRYRLLATGYYAHGAGSRVADAACSWHVADDEGWSSVPQARSSASALKLTVDGVAGWRARDGRSCDEDEHVYVWDYTPKTTGPVTVAIDDHSRADDVGALALRVLVAGADVSGATTPVPDISPEPFAPPAVTTGDPLEGTEVLSVDAAGGGRTKGVLQAGREYTVEVAGTWSAGEGVVADAQCSRTSSGTWRRQHSSDPLHSWIDSFDLYVDGLDLQSRTGGCNAAHVYRYRIVAGRTSQASFAVWDATPGDDTGSLQVTIWPRPRW